MGVETYMETIRPAEKKDYDAIYDLKLYLNNHCHKINPCLFYYKIELHDYEKKSIGEYGFVLQAGDEIIGFFNGYPKEKYQENDSGIFFVETLVIKESYQNKNYGKKLFKFIEKYAKEKNCAFIGLQTLNNEKMLNFYKSNGMKIECMTLRIKFDVYKKRIVKSQKTKERKNPSKYEPDPIISYKKETDLDSIRFYNNKDYDAVLGMELYSNNMSCKMEPGKHYAYQYVLETAGEAVGYFDGYTSGTQDKNGKAIVSEFKIKTFAVKGSLQNSNYGHRLFEHIGEFAKENGFEYITLEIQYNAELLNFYMTNGMKIDCLYLKKQIIQAKEFADEAAE